MLSCSPYAERSPLLPFGELNSSLSPAACKPCRNYGLLLEETINLGAQAAMSGPMINRSVSSLEASDLAVKFQIGFGSLEPFVWPEEGMGAGISHASRAYDLRKKGKASGWCARIQIIRFAQPRCLPHRNDGSSLYTRHGVVRRCRFASQSTRARPEEA